MSSTQDIPADLRTHFNRLIRTLPAEIEDCRETRKAVLAYLKLGGIKVVRQWIEICKRRQRERFVRGQIQRMLTPLGVDPDAAGDAEAATDSDAAEETTEVFDVETSSHGADLFQAYCLDPFHMAASPRQDG